MKTLTPSEFYKMRRPEYFSDSEIIIEIKLTREQLAFELSKISTNQKHDEFERLCRRLAEIFISPNLIPQVGPTGGGDGKTDSETYPVSTTISERWFVPEKGWDKDEKWAFAFSAKKTWKTKIKSDVKKIVNTGRGFTRIFFITNQTPSSKQKKDTEEELKKTYGFDITILDSEWILEKLFNNDLIDLVVDSLNLSDVFKKKKVNLGQNDAYRSKKLEEIEEQINNPKRYFEYDYQLVEDALESAILSRMLEKSRDEVEGKFDRAFRFCKKVNIHNQWIRLYYQLAWTHLNWYNDYSSFINDFVNFKKWLSRTSSISEIELYVNLFHLLKGLENSGNCNLNEYKIDLKAERKRIVKYLNEFVKNDQKPCSSLIAKSFKAIFGLTDSISKGEKPDKYLKELSIIFTKSKGYFDYPFDNFTKLIEELGDLFPNHIEFDHLIDCIASVSEKRNSELAAGETYLKRGVQKLNAKYYKESVVYFGKAVLKLAKEESRYGMYLSLIGLSEAYNFLGLLWASNNCLISASSISFKSWYDTGVINKRTYYCAKQLAINELLIGRVPSFLTWHELFLILSRQIYIEQSDKHFPDNEFIDICFANRILNTTNNNEKVLSVLPDLLNSHELLYSRNSVLFKLGYIELILDDYKGIDIKDEQGLDEYFKLIANQPFREQMIYETNFMSENKISLYSTILGCRFILRFERDIELLFASETFLAFFECFFATSLTDVFPHTESIVIDIIKNPKDQIFNFYNKNSSSEYILEINIFKFLHEIRDKIWTSMLDLISRLLANNFFINDTKEYLEHLFINEEVNERLSIIFEHRNFTINILGTNPKLFFSDWISTKTYKEYSMKRETSITYKIDKQKDILHSKNEINPEKISHHEQKVLSIIDVNLWNQAKWQGFGFFLDSKGLGIIIAFENIEAGKNIFDNWIKKFGNEDQGELIKITIIKGVNINNPFWYRVHISPNIEKGDFKINSLILSTSRIHEMNASSSQNLDELIRSYNLFKQFRLIPAKVLEGGKNIDPFLDRAILKRILNIRNAWEIGGHDMDSVVIKKGDSPIIPNNVIDPPILELLQRINK